MNFVNLLDKPVVVLQDYYNDQTILPDSRRNQIEKISTFCEDSESRFNLYTYQVRGLPEPVEGTFYITEKEIVALFPERTDLVFCARTEVPFFPHDEGSIRCLGFGRF